MRSWGPVTSASCAFHRVTPSPPFGSGRGPSPSPRLAGLPRPPFQKKHPSPFLPKLGLASAGLPRGRRWGNGPSSSGLRGESWPVASHNRPGDTEGTCLGDPRSHVNLRSRVGPPPLFPLPPRRSTSTGFVVRWPVGAADLSSPSMGWEAGQKGVRGRGRVATVRLEGGDSGGRGAGKALDPAVGQTRGPGGRG